MFRKGERFSVVSPLDRASKEFLGQFLNDANTQVLSAENLSVDQVLVANAVREENNSAERSRQTLQKHWADPLVVGLLDEVLGCGALIVKPHHRRDRFGQVGDKHAVGWCRAFQKNGSMLVGDSRCVVT